MSHSSLLDFLWRDGLKTIVCILNQYLTSLYRKLPISLWWKVEIWSKHFYWFLYCLSYVYVLEAVDFIVLLTLCELLNLIERFSLRMTWIIGVLYHDQSFWRKIKPLLIVIEWWSYHFWWSNFLLSGLWLAQCYASWIMFHFLCYTRLFSSW